LQPHRNALSPLKNAAKLEMILISPPPLPRVLIKKIILPLQSPLIFAVFCRFFAAKR
jgi:hypothetical protein